MKVQIKFKDAESIKVGVLDMYEPVIMRAFLNKSRVSIPGTNSTIMIDFDLVYNVIITESTE